MEASTDTHTKAIVSAAIGQKGGTFGDIIAVISTGVARRAIVIPSIQNDMYPERGRSSRALDALTSERGHVVYSVSLPSTVLYRSVGASVVAHDDQLLDVRKQLAPALGGPALRYADLPRRAAIDKDRACRKDAAGNVEVVRGRASSSLHTSSGIGVNALEISQKGFEKSAEKGHRLKLRDTLLEAACARYWRGGP